VTENSTSLPGEMPENDEAMAEAAVPTDVAGGPEVVNESTSEPSGEPAVEEPAKRKRRFPWKVLGVVAGVALLVALVLPVFSMLQPGYYKRYPSLHARMENWQVSTHAKVPCSGCHVNPGAGGFVSFAGRSIPAFYSQLIYGPKSNNLFASPSRQACQKCHTTYRQVSPNGDLLIPHRAHVQVLKLDCPVCHKDLVHSVNEQGFNRPEMETCLETCHDGKKATNQCVKCHTQKQVPESHLQKNWLAVHPEMVNKIDCSKCHAWTPKFCDDCHSKKPKSHVGNWKKNHAAAAKARGEKGCLVCHGGEKFCKKCHD